MKKLFGGLLGCALGLMFASDAQAIIWPSNSQWIPLKVGGANYADIQGDYNPEEVDIVGGIDTLGSNYTAGFYFTDPANMMFRMRIDNAPGANPQLVWTVMINTNLDTHVDWVLQLDLKTDNQVELAKTNSLTDFGAVVAYVTLLTPHTNNWAAADYSRTDQNASLFDGSRFHQSSGDDDYFIDIAMPIADFFRVTGLTNTDPIYIALGTSANHETLNKDRPDSQGYFSDPIYIPEPGALALASVGAVVLGCFRRRRH